MAWPAVRSFVRDESWGVALQLSVPMGRASLAPSSRGTIAHRARAARPRRRRRRLPRRPRRPGGDRRADAHAARGPRHAGRARRARRAADRARRARGEVPRRRPRPGPGRGQPDAHRPVPAGGQGREGTVGHGARAPAFGPRTAGAARCGRMDRGRGLAPGRRRPGDGPLPRPDTDGQGVPAARGRRPPGARPRCRRDGAGRARPGAHARGLARPDPASTRASSRTCSATRRSSRGSGTRTRTRSCGRPGSSRSASGRRSRAEEVDELYRATRSVLAASVELLRRRVPPTFEKQVRDHLAVHNRGGEACPRCGTRITEVKAGGFPTGFCRGCQR